MQQSSISDLDPETRQYLMLLGHFLAQEAEIQTGGAARFTRHLASSA
jgi:hypothetical protein